MFISSIYWEPHVWHTHTVDTNMGKTVCLWRAYSLIEETVPDNLVVSVKVEIHMGATWLPETACPKLGKEATVQVIGCEEVEEVLFGNYHPSSLPLVYC